MKQHKLRIFKHTLRIFIGVSILAVVTYIHSRFVGTPSPVTDRDLNCKTALGSEMYNDTRYSTCLYR